MTTTPPETGYSSLGGTNAGFGETNVAEFAVPPSHQIPAVTSPAHYRPPAMESALQSYADAVGRAFGAASRTYSRWFDRARGYTEEKYSEVERETKNLGRRAQKNASYVREQYPLEALGAIAATAFVAGIALRVWRSRAS
ncbi:hypothetical protein [Occallatibacter savannae]|uniref:hypothetical protein n=1 Tax=Occallatibacter savannae TaxID=1002691 RepID=UPI0013A58662|nr:hypothetical protein [Occallatibacter savannae]